MVHPTEPLATSATNPDAAPAPTLTLAVATPPVEVVKHNSKSLLAVATRLGVDFTSASLASFMVSPFITVLDRAIIENAAGTRTITDSLKEVTANYVRHPLRFLNSKEFKLVFGLYHATYWAANTADTLCEWGGIDNTYPKFASTTSVNMTLVIYKDLMFTRWFGTARNAAIPLATIGLFAVRDGMTCASSFNLPEKVAAKMEKAGMSQGSAWVNSQILCPSVAQMFSTPLHLVALDLMNRPKATSTQRMALIRKEYIPSAIARVARIGPAFGIGGLGNMASRDYLLNLTEGNGDSE